MINMPIQNFWSFKQRNGVQNQTLREKLSKDRPFQKNLLLVNGQCIKSNSNAGQRST